MKRKSNRSCPVCAICSTLGTALLIMLILLCLPFTLNRFMDCQVYTVISGSMEPVIPIGSLVYIKEMEPEDVQIGDIISYYGNRDTNAIITHRVTENRVIMGEFITKGDANLMEDINPVSYDHFIGKVEVVIPQLGILAQIMTSREGKIIAGCMIAFAVVLHLLAMVLDRK